MTFHEGQWLLRRRRAQLTREEERKLATTIEQATRGILEVVARSALALKVFTVLVEDFRDGSPDCEGLLSTPCDTVCAADELLAFLPRESSRIGGCSDASMRTASAGEEFVEVTMRYGLSHVGLERLLERLTTARDRCRMREKRALDFAISAIRENHRVAEQAKAKFVEANIPLVIWMAARRSRGALDTSDLVQEGCLGLIRAVEKFDYRRDIKFSTYAVWWIRQAMNRAVSDKARTIRMPVHVLEKTHKAARLVQQFKQEHGRDPSEIELSKWMGLSADMVRDLFTAPKEPISLDAPLGVDGGSRIGDTVVDRESASALERVSQGRLGFVLQGLLNTLSPREAEVLRLRFGVDCKESLSLEEVGRRFGISRERVRQIEAEALTKLKQRAIAQELDSYLSS